MIRIGNTTIALFFSILLTATLWMTTACSPIPPPKDAYKAAPSLLEDFETLRGKARSFRITGRIENRGDNHWMQGKVYLFALFPGLLRIELISPFNTPLSVLTVNGRIFALHDLREGRYLTGPADPCNIARLIQVPMPPGDVMKILLGNSPRIEGAQKITWNKKGFYQVVIQNDNQIQRLEIGSLKSELPLLKSRLEDKHGTIFEITYDRWYPIKGISMPHEIHIQMPRDQVDIRLRYNKTGVELNVSLPEEAFSQSPPSGTVAEQSVCYESYE
jgi:hypothetical protein